MDYYDEYIDYKLKYLRMIGGGNKKKLNIIILHYPTVYNKPEIPVDILNCASKLSSYGKIHHYFFTFSYFGNKFTLKDLEFENVAKDINNKFKKLNNKFIVAINHGCPYGLFYVNKYPKKIKGIICYPYRFYCQESYDRRIWKLKNNDGFKLMIKNKKYNVDKHLLNINESTFSKLFDDLNDDTKSIIYLVVDMSLQRQHNKIPDKFKIPTFLYTRLDLDVPSLIKNNYDRKDIAKMKQIFTTNDALQNSMIWNFDRVKYDAHLMESNKNNNNLKIRYLVSGWENYQDIIDCLISFLYSHDHLMEFNNLPKL